MTAAGPALPHIPAAPHVPAPPHLVVDDFLSDAERAGLLNWALQNSARFDAATVNGIAEPRVRQSLSLRDLGPFAELLRTRARARTAEWIAALQVTPFEPSRYELELVAQNDGSFFTIHSDTYGPDRQSAGDRMLSAVYYFHRAPQRFSGGELRLHRLGARAGDDGHDLSPAQGRLIVFPSWWPHEVRPVSCPTGAFADSRFSVNCWIYRNRSA